MTNLLATAPLPLAAIGDTLITLIWIVQLALLIYVLLDLARYFMTPAPNPVIQAHNALGTIWEPVLRPIRNALPSMGGIDFSPLIVLLLLSVLSGLLA